MPHFVIAGGGTAAVTAARTLRAEGFDGRITLVGAEPVLPYRRPPLSKEYLTGAADVDELMAHAPDWYAENSVEVLLSTRVERVTTAESTLTLADGRELAYDRLLLATGGRPRRLPSMAGDRVLYLRDLADADLLADRIAAAGRLVILGGGFIGCEVAASARKLGVEVTVLEMLDVPLQRVLGDRLGGIVAAIHRDHAVEVRTREQVETVVDTADGVLITTDKGRIECGVLLVAIGLQPNLKPVDGTDIKCDNGILVDQYCRTSVPTIYAAGDVANHFHPLHGRHLRVEHHDNAVKQGAVAARNMLGQKVAFDDPHWFWSDQYEHNIQSLGVVAEFDDVVIRGSVDERCFSAFYLDKGRVASVFALDRGKDIVAGRKILRAGIEVTAAALRDESVDLRRLVPRDR